MNFGYYSRVLKIIARDRHKLKSVWRLKTGGEHRSGRYLGDKTGFSAPPITVAIRRSFRCNLHCIQCGQWGEHGIFKDIDPDDLSKKELTTEEIKRFITEIAPSRPYIYFTGGEPLLNDDIFELIEHASSNHLITGMSSNSTLLEDSAERLIDAGLDYYYASLDAPGDLNDEIRRGEDTFQRAVAGIKKLIRLREENGVGLPIVQVQTIIVKENQDSLYRMAEFVEDVIGADVWGLQLCVFTTPEANKLTEEIYKREYGVDAVYWRGFIMDFTSGVDYEKLDEELKNIRGRSWKFRLRLYDPLTYDNFNFKDYFENPEKPMTNPPCMYPYSFAQLQPNGDIAFCGSQPDYVIGNIKDNGFNGIWNNEKARDFRLFMKKSPLPACSRCFGMYIFSKYK
ncbi:MAG: radical SAM protein [Candidatus Altiarchaeota archaeon]